MRGKTKKVREKKETTLFLAVIPILAMILLLGVGYAVMGLSPEVLMLVSAAIAGVIAIYLGYTWDDIMDSIVSKLSRSFFADSSYMLSFSVLCSCVCSRLISPSVSSWHKQDNTLMHQSPGHIQRRTPYNF